MKHKIFLLLIPMFSFIFCQANLPEYDICLLAPQEESIKVNYCYNHLHLTESGYVLGALIICNQETYFIYTPDKKFHLFKFKDKHLLLLKINEDGIIFGQYLASVADDIDYQNIRTFYYNFKTDVFHDICIYDQASINLSMVTVWKQGLILKDIKSNQFFIYDISLDTLLPTSLSIKKMNSKGQVIGENSTEGWFYDPIFGYQKLVFSDSTTQPEKLSDSGWVTGKSMDHISTVKGFLWHLEHGFIPINTLGNAGFYIFDINQKGQVVGDSEIDDEAEHAFLFDRELGGVDLGTLGGLNSKAISINNMTKIVGNSEYDPKLTKTRAFIWDEFKGMRDLTALIPHNTGWEELHAATSINDQGYIVGTGIYKGIKHAFVLIPRYYDSAKNSNPPKKHHLAGSPCSPLEKL